MGNHSEAEDHLLVASRMIPSRHYPYYLLAKLYADTSFFDSEKLRYYAGEAIAREPKVNSPAIQEMKAELKELLRPDR